MNHCNLKTSRYAICLFVIGAFFAVSAPYTAMAEDDFILDHFQCYSVFGPAEEVPGPVTVGLEDQFDTALGIVETAEVWAGMRYFCNPTSKSFGGTTTSISHNDHHLTFYTFKESSEGQPSIVAEVKIYNQFGSQKLVVHSANLLAVPTQKLEPIGHQAPEGLDHFKCYIVTDANNAPHGIVELEDQFSLSPTKHKLRGEPLLFCNPVNKTDPSGVKSGILHSEAHLTCYDLKPSKSPFYTTTGERQR